MENRLASRRRSHIRPDYHSPTTFTDLAPDCVGVKRKAESAGNPSRPRLRYVTYFQTSHQQPSPWLLDLNGLMHGGPRSLDFLAPWDRTLASSTARCRTISVARLQALGVENVMVQTIAMGKERAKPLLMAFRAQGAEQVANDGERVLLRLPQPSG